VQGTLLRHLRDLIDVNLLCTLTGVYPNCADTVLTNVEQPDKFRLFAGKLQCKQVLMRSSNRPTCLHEMNPLVKFFDKRDDCDKYASKSR